MNHEDQAGFLDAMQEFSISCSLKKVTSLNRSDNIPSALAPLSEDTNMSVF
ncbi:MAG: hypothetical protein WBZ36_10910 [Candidatus Nitrosopolaris sp.]